MKEGISMVKLPSELQNYIVARADYFNINVTEFMVKLMMAGVPKMEELIKTAEEEIEEEVID